ncbi:hypothetical protein BaRGS_00025911 [Batillaria attramentaria]|uniref:Uncharacterized protein n=1 Tax=Batillaria attramentaria TaxID=370345 RepID=A0ABD0K7G4_9CAEN
MTGDYRTSIAMVEMASKWTQTGHSAWCDLCHFRTKQPVPSVTVTKFWDVYYCADLQREGRESYKDAMLTVGKPEGRLHNKQKLLMVYGDVQTRHKQYGES